MKYPNFNLFENFNFKFIFAIVFASLFASSFAYAECSFTSRDESCEIFTSPFNSFNLNFVEDSQMENFSVNIYDKFNTKNLFRLDVDFENRVVKNINPFTRPGVYVLDVIAKNRAGKSFSYKKEFLFDNLKPNMPVIELNLDTDTTTTQVLGTSLFAEKIVVYDKFGSEIKSIDVLADGSFKFNLDLARGLNFFKFRTLGENGLLSDAVERIIFSKSNVPINLNPVVSNINLDNNDLVNEMLDGYTLKRNHYVSGNIGASNSRVYINGNPVVSDEFGNFGGFVNLNQGDNKIRVLAGGLVKEYDVYFVLNRFKFTNFNAEKFVSMPSVDLQIGASYDAPFEIYLNGEFVTAAKTSLGSYNYKLNNLREGQNYIYLVGLDGERLEKLIYYDSKKPLIDVVTPQTSSGLKYFIFEVEDDFGFDIKKTIFKLNGVTVDNENLEVRGNYFIYEFEDLPANSYSYSVLVYDLAGNFVEKFGSFSISELEVSIEDIFVKNGIVLGNRIFLDSLGNKKFGLIPSENIAFKSISIDGEDITDYKISRDNSVELNLEFVQDSGEISFNFINFENREFTQTFTYEILQKPTVEIDFITRPYLEDSETFLVSGIITSDYFDWNSFKVNSVSGKRFGNYFENYVTFSSSKNLFFTGKDYLGNSLSFVFYGVGVDNSNVRISLNDDENSFSGSINNFQNKIMNFALSYDGIYSNQILTQSFDLVPAQRSGLRNLNLKGERSSLVSFEKKELVSVDGINPEIYFLENKVVLLGTLTAVDRVLVDGVETSFVPCNTDNKLSNNCVETDLVDVGSTIEVFDKAQNSFSRTYSGNADNYQVPNVDISYYFTGNDVYVDSREHFVQGQIVSKDRVVDVDYNVNGGNSGSCNFDEYNFVCDLILPNQNSLVYLTIKTEDGSVYEPDVPDGNNSDGDGSTCEEDPSQVKCLGYCEINPDAQECKPSYCELNPQDPDCQDPPFCEIYPNDVKCKSFCELNPSHADCVIDFCDENPNHENCKDVEPPVDFCEQFPEDEKCKSFCELNPSHPDCDENYCEKNPSDEAYCKSFCELNPTHSDCAVDFCDENPSHADCQIIEPPVDFCEKNPSDAKCKSFCELNPNHPDCQVDVCDVDPNNDLCKSFCELYPNDFECNPNFCQSNPSDSRCGIFCDLFPDHEQCQIDICDLTPSLEVCQVDFCKENPTHERCADDLCEIEPENDLCKSFCDLNPNDELCNILPPVDCDNQIGNPEFITICPPQNETIDLSLEKIYGAGVYQVLNNFYFDVDLVNFKGFVSKNLPIKLVINNEELLVGEFDGNINILNVDLSEQTAGTDSTNIETKLRLTDEYGVDQDSNTLVLMYNRILKTLIDVIVN